MNRVMLSGLMLCCVAAQMMAVPARRNVVREYDQPDGTTVSLSQWGDEFNHFYLTTDGLPVMSDASGRYCYVTVSDAGEAVISDVVVRNVSERTATDHAFISSLNLADITSALNNRDKDSKKVRRRATQSSDIGLFEHNFPHTGSPKALLILVAFSNKSFSMSDPEAYYDDFLMGENFTQDGGTGSCYQYFVDNSNGVFKPQFDCYYTQLSNTYSYYGANDSYGDDAKAHYMVRDACDALDSQINFADYDTDGDGYVDNVYVIYAGRGEADGGGANTIWPHAWSLSAGFGTAPTYDGVKVDSYGCCNEMDASRPAGIGTFCHEFSHVLGLPDLYTTDYGSAEKLTPGEWSVLDYGPYNNDGRTPPAYSIFERNALGWIDPIVLSDPASITLQDIKESNSGCIVLTADKNEFFLFENRQQTGWDKYVPGHGLLVWHIDYDETVWNQNVVNNTASHQYVDIEEANGSADNTSTSKMAGYPFPGTSNKTSFTDSTSPSMKTWSGTALNTPITEIEEVNGVIYFNVCGGKIDLEAPVVEASDITGCGFTLTWNAVEGATSYLVTIKSASSGDATVVETVAGYDNLEVEGTSLVISRLQPLTTYYATVTAKRASNISPESAPAIVTTTEATFDMTIPVVEEAGYLGGNAFIARWLPVENAENYYLTVETYVASEPESETADFGSSSIATLPDGWVASTTSTYTGAGYYGNDAPSLKLSSDKAYLQTRTYDNDIETLSFWACTSGTVTDNYLELYAGIDNGSDFVWSLVATYNNIPKNGNGATYTFSDFPEGTRAVKFLFVKVKSGENLALDDVVVATKGDTSGVVSGYDNLSVGNVTQYNVIDLPTDCSTFYYYVIAENASGVKTQASDKMFVNLSEINTVMNISVSEMSVITMPDGIFVNADDDAPIVVVDIAGRVIATARTNQKISLPTGFFIVTTTGAAKKIMIE